MDTTVILLLQMTAIVVCARIAGEILRAFNQPSVLGELAAGVLLGPSLLGQVWPAGYQQLFQQTDDLEKIATLGLILLMLLTGLETDARVLRNMGRAAFTASFFGMVIPFACGFVLGQMLDDHFIILKDRGRLPLSLFMATAMAISAMPVIAKILIDLKMVKRNLGIVTLSAAVVDDTIGWIILAVISGLVTQQTIEIPHILKLFGMLALFLAFAAFILFPFLRYILPRVERFSKIPHGDLVILAATAFLCAAATQAMRVHAVFGAFVAGMVIRQCPTLNAESIHRLESVTFSIFAPLFFGLIGLRVDLFKLHNIGLLAVVIGVAVLGKIVGCFIGGILGKMPAWEALALGFCMSARGAMELVVAKIGLDLKILDGELFAIIVIMAITTSFLAPLMVRAIAGLIPPSEEEKKREKVTADRFVQPGKLKILVPVSGGPNALIACHIATHLCTTEADHTTAVYVEISPPRWWEHVLFFWRPSQANIDIANYFERTKRAAGKFAAHLATKKVTSAGGVAKTILTEAENGANFLFMGASNQRHPIYDPLLSDLLQESPCHVVVVAGQKQRAHVHAGEEPVAPGHDTSFKRILVPINGSFVADAAFDFAAQYAESAGAHVTVLFVAQSHRSNLLLPTDATDIPDEYMQETIRESLRKKFGERIKSPASLTCLVRTDDLVIGGIVKEAQLSESDLVVIGAENRSLVGRLYLGQHIEAALDQIRCTIAIVVPKVGSV